MIVLVTHHPSLSSLSYTHTPSPLLLHMHIHTHTHTFPLLLHMHIHTHTHTHTHNLPLLPLLHMHIHTHTLPSSLLYLIVILDLHDFSLYIRYVLTCDCQHLTQQWHMWQSRVEIEHYSVVYFDRVTVLKAL